MIVDDLQTHTHSLCTYVYIDIKKGFVSVCMWMHQRLWSHGCVHYTHTHTHTQTHQPQMLSRSPIVPLRAQGQKPEEQNTTSMAIEIRCTHKDSRLRSPRLPSPVLLRLMRRCRRRLKRSRSRLTWLLLSGATAGSGGGSGGCGRTARSARNGVDAWEEKLRLWNN